MTEKKNRTLIPKKLKLIPAAAMSVVVLAVLSLLGLLNFNPPSLSDSNSAEEASETEREAETSNSALVSTDAPQVAAESDSDTSTQETESSPTESEVINPLELVDVLIDGDRYLMAIGQRGEDLVREARTVAEIVEACLATAGDSSGVKIRVTRTFEATAQAEKTLMTAVKQSGLVEDQIDQRRTLVDP